MKTWHLAWLIVAALSCEAKTSVAGLRERADEGNAEAKAPVADLRERADQGLAEAQFNLGYAYYMGEGVTQDSVEAVKWYRKAAEQGHATAQLKLGLVYYLGDGVTQDYAEAHKWFNLSAAAGDTSAGELRDILAQKMTPEQIAEAQRLAREWKPKE